MTTDGLAIRGTDPGYCTERLALPVQHQTVAAARRQPETGYRDIDSSPTKTAILQLKRSGQDDRYYALSMGQRPAEELYHIETDRECLANRIGDVSCRILADSLRAELFRTLRGQGDPRMTGDGDLFDRYPYDKPGKDRIYEQTVSGEIIPWEQSNWSASDRLRTTN